MKSEVSEGPFYQEGTRLETGKEFHMPVSGAGPHTISWNARNKFDSQFLVCTLFRPLFFFVPHGGGSGYGKDW